MGLTKAEWSFSTTGSVFTFFQIWRMHFTLLRVYQQAQSDDAVIIPWVRRDEKKTFRRLLTNCEAVSIKQAKGLGHFKIRWYDETNQTS